MANRSSVVHDPTARHMGGVAGHAGLFLTAQDLARYARMFAEWRDTGWRADFQTGDGEVDDERKIAGRRDSEARVGMGH